jgi:DNA polymerase III sliding clamp (beta) subunit (PCNA family)
MRPIGVSSILLGIAVTLLFAGFLFLRRNPTVHALILDIGLEFSVPVKIEEEGAIAVPGNILAGFLSQLTNEKSVLLEVKEGNLYVSSSKNSTHSIILVRFL